MIQQQSWDAARQEFCRTLPLPKLFISHDKLRLAELADVATRLGQLNVSSRSTSPSSSSVELTPTTEGQQCRLPSFSETFSDVIAAQDGVGSSHQYYTHGPHTSLARRGSPGYEYSRQGSLSGVPGLSPLSTTHASPAVSPTTPHIHSQSLVTIQVRLREYPDELCELSRKEPLALARPRRRPARPSPYGFDTPGARRGSGSKKPPGPNDKGAKRRRHFNKKYENPDKLFIVYAKEDLQWGWQAIKARRLELLPVLLESGYDRSVEEHREIDGLNGMYYRENGDMPVLTPDGSGLEFVERDGRWWECTRKQTCRAGHGNTCYPSNMRGTRRVAGGVAARPRGMAERYPEEVLLYWERHVRHFVAEEKQAEVYARAKRYCEIRAEQRRQHGVPQWSLDNKEDRVLDLNEDGGAGENNSPQTGKTSRRTRRS